MSDYNVDTLENKIVVEAQEAIKNIQQIIGYGNKLKETINSIGNASGLKNVNKDTKKATSNLTKMQLMGKSLKSIFNFAGITYGLKRVYGFLESSTEKSIDYIETLNLFEVSMGKTLDKYGNLDSASSKYYTRALKFQKDLNERLGTNMEETMRYQALYNQMAESMGINDDASYVISENLTKLGIDLASLFNRTEEDTMEALRAGVLAGQTKPLRNYGLDVTQQTLAPLASELGIKRSVKQLSQAEKMVLRYIAVLRQASSAHGDFASTIESPANQLKVFKQQFIELKTAVGNFFQGLLGQILPYVNGVLMVIKELLKAVGSLFGFKVESANTNLAQKTGVEDLNTGLGGAVGKAKELKAQLMGFDEINNITTDTSSGGSSGGGVSSTGIDSKLLNALSEYDNLMAKVKMKATDIRDKIMDWLGFTKIINPLTGDISWKLRDGWTNLKKIWTIIKGLIGLAITVKIVKLIGSLTKLWNALKTSKTATSTFGVGLQTLNKGFSSMTTWVKLGIEQFGLYRKAGDSVTTALGKTAKGMSSLVSPAVKATAGITGLAVSLWGAYDSMKGFKEGTKSTGFAFTELGVSIAGASASGAILGSIIPGIGTGLGALAGALIGATTGLIGYNSAMDETQIKLKETRQQWAEHNEIVKKSAEEWNGMVNAVQETLNGNLAEIENTQRLTNELENLVDSNGKVKKGYEARVEYILNNLNNALGTEYKLVDNQITKNGEIINSYKDIKNEVYKLIEAKKAQAIYEANASMYAESLKRQQEYYNKLETSQNNYNQSLADMQGFLNYYKDENNYKWIAEQLDDCNVTVEDIINNTEKWQGALGLIRVDSIGMAQQLGKEAEEHRNMIKQNEESYNSAARTYKQANDFIIAQDNLGTAILTGNKEEINKALEDLTSTYETETGTQTATFSQRISNQIAYSNQLKEKLKENNIEITEDTKKQLNAGLQATVDNLKQQSILVNGELSQDIINGWKTLAEKNVDVYNKEIKTLPEDVRRKVQETTSNIVSETNSALPKVKTASANIRDVITKNMDGTFSIKFGLNADYSGLKSQLISMRNTLNKMSNVPMVGSAFGKYAGNLNSLISQLSVAGFAEGGFPNMGELFMAREAGPELVGRIGRRTAVANNAQIVEAVSSGVYSAVSEAMRANNNSGSMTVSGKLNGKELVQFTIDGINGVKQQTGECPIEIL